MGNLEQLLTRTHTHNRDKGLMPHQWADHIHYCGCDVNQPSEERRAPFLNVLLHSFVNTQSFQH